MIEDTMFDNDCYALFIESWKGENDGEDHE